MKKLNKKLIIIKFGSSTLVDKNINDDVCIDYNNILNLGLIINEIKNPVIIVSSGAVVFGKTFGKNFDYIENEIIKKRIFAAIGNPHLSINWDKAIKNKLILQSLITHRDLISKDSQKKIEEIIFNLYLKNDAIIQVNDNDFITDEELKKLRGDEFGDNDRTTQLITNLCVKIFDEVEVIFNISSNGVYEDNKILEKINVNKLSKTYINKICNLKNNLYGTGGMSNKLQIIKNLVLENKNLKIHIINGKKPNQLKLLLQKKKIGTSFYI